MYSRELNENILTLDPTGWTYDLTFVLFDRETESLWYPLNRETGLTGISGLYSGRKLARLPSTRTSWKEWHAEHPNSEYLQDPSTLP